MPIKMQLIRVVVCASALVGRLRLGVLGRILARGVEGCGAGELPLPVVACAQGEVHAEGGRELLSDSGGLAEVVRGDGDVNVPFGRVGE